VTRRDDPATTADRIAALEAECARLRALVAAEGMRVASLTGVLRALVGAVEAEPGRPCPRLPVTAAQAGDIAYAEAQWDAGERDRDDAGALTMSIGGGSWVCVTERQVEVTGAVSYTRPRGVAR